MSLEDFHAAALPYIKQAVSDISNTDTELIAKCLHQRTEVLTDIIPQLDFVDTLAPYDTDIFVNKKSKSTCESSKLMLEKSIELLESLPDWQQETLHDALIGLAEKLEVKNGLLMWPVRVAASGKTVTPGGAIEVLGILGREKSLERLKLGLEKLGK